MSEQMESLLTDLAAQLGTTTEYLWAALLRQAPLSSTVGLVVLMAVLVAVLAVGRVAIRGTKGMTDGCHEWSWGLTFVCLVLWACFGVGVAMPGILAGFFNPEFWALRELLQQLGIGGTL